MAERDEHHSRVEREFLARFPFDPCILRDEAGAEVLGCLAEIRIVRFEEKCDGRRDLTADQNAHSAQEQVLRVAAGGGVLRGVRPSLNERAEAEAHLIVDLDDSLSVREYGKKENDCEECEAGDGGLEHGVSL